MKLASDIAHNYLNDCCIGVVYEQPRVSSDGDNDKTDASDEVIAPNSNNYIQSNASSNNNVKMRGHRRRLNQQDISKRLSLPAELHIPETFIAKHSLSPTIDGPLSRQMRRQSLVM